MNDIYALIDIDTLNRFDISLIDFVKFIDSHKISVAQYRNKNGSDDDFIRDIKIIRDIFSGKLIINDRTEFADMGDGIHIGQEDLLSISDSPKDAVSDLRDRLSAGKWIGLSTHSSDEILKANELDIDYIGLGAYRKTSTKEDAAVSGEELLEVAKLSSHPVALIGGVRLDDSFKESIIRYRVIGSDLCREYLKKKQSFIL